MRPKFENIGAWHLARDLIRKVNGKKGNPEPVNGYDTRYTRCFNLRNLQSGYLFQGRFRKVFAMGYCIC